MGKKPACAAKHAALKKQFKTTQRQGATLYTSIASAVAKARHTPCGREKGSKKKKGKGKR